MSGALRIIVELVFCNVDGRRVGRVDLFRHAVAV